MWNFKVYNLSWHIWLTNCNDCYKFIQIEYLRFRILTLKFIKSEFTLLHPHESWHQKSKWKTNVVTINLSNLTIRSEKLIRPQLLQVLCFTHMSPGIKHETHTKKSYKSFVINLINSLHMWKPCYQCFQQYYKYNINPSRKKNDL